MAFTLFILAVGAAPIQSASLQHVEFLAPEPTPVLRPGEMPRERAQQLALQVIRSFDIPARRAFSVNLERYVSGDRVWGFSGNEASFKLDQKGQLRFLACQREALTGGSAKLLRQPSDAIPLAKKILHGVGEDWVAARPVRVATPSGGRPSDWRTVSVIFNLWEEREPLIDVGKAMRLLFNRAGQVTEVYRIDNIEPDRAPVRLSRAQAIKRAVEEMTAWRKKLREPAPTPPIETQFGWAVPNLNFGFKGQDNLWPRRARLAWVVDFENMDRMYIDAHDGKLLGGLTGAQRQDWIETHYGRPSQPSEKPRDKR